MRIESKLFLTIAVCLLLLNIRNINAETVEFTEESKEYPTKFVCNIDDDRSNLIFQHNDDYYYIEENKLIKRNIKVNYNDMKNGLTLKNRKNVGNAVVTVNFYEKEISASEKKLLSASPWLTRVDEGLSYMGNIRARLSVCYKYSEELFSSTEDLHLYSATGTWTREGAAEGVAAESSRLYYCAEGRIYRPDGSFWKNGVMGFSKNFTNTRFYDYPLMGDYYIKDCISGGVTYTLNCSRGISIDVRMIFY